MSRASATTTSSPALDGANVVVLVGELSGPPRRRELATGANVVEFDVTTRGESGTGSVPVAWFAPGPGADDLDAGNTIVVVGHVRRRFFRAGGTTQSRTEVVAARVLVNARPAVVRRLKEQVATLLTQAGSSDEGRGTQPLSARGSRSSPRAPRESHRPP